MFTPALSLPVSSRSLGMMCILLTCLCLSACSDQVALPVEGEAERRWLNWEALPDLPDELGMAGPFVGVHGQADTLIVAGGANFPVAEGEDLWEVPKVWHDDAWVLTRRRTADGIEHEWISGLKLDRPRGYGAVVSTPHGVVCMGGDDGETVFDDVFLLQWNAQTRQLVQEPLPSLPEPCAYGYATIIGDVIYLAGGLRELEDLGSAMTNFWRLDLSKRGNPDFDWEILPAWPGPPRAFNITVAQHNGFEDCVYVISGRRMGDDEQAEGLEAIDTLVDVYEFNPVHYDPAAFNAETGEYTGRGRYANPWRQRASLPECVMAGSGIAVGQSHLFILSGSDRESLLTAGALREQFDGFPRIVYAYHTITDTWIEAGESPLNAVTTPAVQWGDGYYLISGEVRPRVRTTASWRITPVPSQRKVFGTVDMTVLVLYLAGMIGIGVFFMTRSKDTDQYFRGGKRVPWWVAGCSIYATMLSSITYMAIPSKAYAQDWVYLIGNFMILAVAPIAIYLALPFFRQIDATSAYEYLQKRFNVVARLFGSASFTVFHIFRMGIVMSLAGLALATVTDLTPGQCVLIMGVLSIIYCTLGGIEAVVWTDTIQTFVLLGGAILCVVLMIAGADGGIGQTMTTAWDDSKLNMTNFHWDITTANLALWVVILGAFGQNISSYTADQAVVQRYMTTSDRRRAANAIWTNGWMSAFGSILFFALGTALYVFYKSNPEKLDPTYNTDQIFPLFISHQVPIGIAGLIVAGIFAAAQSTISTSMNSTTTTVVTDFIRPLRLHALGSETAYLWLARVLTFTFGVLGTLLGLVFVDPKFRSLFDAFISTLGLFMGVLCGLFALGILTRKANGIGSIIGAFTGAVVMAYLVLYSDVVGYVYAFVGFLVCFTVGYIASLVLPRDKHDIDGLTLHTLKRSND